MERWGASVAESTQMFEEAGVELVMTTKEK